jgi:hypothetical protein
MRCGARLHADEAVRQLLKQRQHLRSPQLLGDNHFAGRVDAMHLEHVLGQIDPERGNLQVDGPLMVIRLTTITLWHFDAASGRRPPHQDWTPIGGQRCEPLDSQDH